MKFITLVHEDQTGLIAEVSELLETAGINIDNIHARSVEGVAEIRIETSDYTRTLTILNGAGYKAVPMENILVRVEDRPGALARVSRRLSDMSIDIRGITMVQQCEGFNIIAITTDNDGQARKVLSDILVA